MAKPLTYDDFVKKAKEKHGDLYDYSKSTLNGAHNRTEIICPKHGTFLQTPSEHLQGRGCPKCANERVHDKQRKTQEQFIKEVTAIFGDKYDFSKTKYEGAFKKVVVTCPEHGDFYIKPNDLLMGHGCSACSKTRPLTTEIFKERARKIFGNKYTYDHVEYKNLGTHVNVTCPKHGDFPVSPRNFLNGYGCPKCNQSHLEREVEVFLSGKGIEYIYQYKPEWCGTHKIDFYIPSLNIAIECQGRQHFSSIDYFKGDWGFDYVKKNDFLKSEACRENGVALYYLLYSNKVSIPDELSGLYNVDNTFYSIEDLWNKVTMKRLVENKIYNAIRQAAFDKWLIKG